MNIEQRIIGCGILFFLTIGAGICLSYTGKPYNTMIFTIHKLIALSAVIFTGILIHYLFKNVEIKSLIDVLIVIAVLAIVALFISGALMSIGSISYVLAKRMHIISTVIAVGATAFSLFLLIGRSYIKLN